MLDYDYLGDSCHLLCHAPIPVAIEKVYDMSLNKPHTDDMYVHILCVLNNVYYSINTQQS